MFTFIFVAVLMIPIILISYYMGRKQAKIELNKRIGDIVMKIHVPSETEDFCRGVMFMLNGLKDIR